MSPFEQPPDGLPEGYAVVELATGRFWPVLVDVDRALPSLTPLSWEWQRIPFARGPHHPTGVVGFATRREAVRYCQRQAEEWNVLYACDQLAASSEVYPERTVWYEEAIIQHCSFVQPRWYTPRPRLERWSDRFLASVWISSTGQGQTIQISAATKDEACVALYEQLLTQLGPAPDEQRNPERNEQYQEEIEAVAGGVVTVFIENGQAAADVRLRDGTFLHARAASMEAALQRLCEQVYAHLGLDWWQSREVLSTGEH